jgi:hypothetical protein
LGIIIHIIAFPNLFIYLFILHVKIYLKIILIFL